MDNNNATLVVKNCRIIDVSRGKFLDTDTLVIAGDRIRSFDASFSSSGSTTIIDAEGAYVVPGFMDMHVHMCVEPDPVLHSAFRFDEPQGFAFLRAQRNLQTALFAGITLVRDVGSPNRHSVGIKQAAALGLLQSPRIIACGRAIIGENGWGMDIGRRVRGVEEAREVVREKVQAGADFIKVINDPVVLSLEELSAITDEAHKLKRRVACHAYKPDAVELALRAGVDTIEHAAPAATDILKECLQRGVTIVPTYVCGLDTMDFERSLVEPGTEETFIEWLELLESGLPVLLQSGVNVAVGTDAGYPPVDFGSACREMEYFVNLGATNLKALQAATISAAQAVGLDDELGTMEVGKLADFVILRENPLRDITAVHRVKMVVLSGQLVRAQ